MSSMEEACVPEGVLQPLLIASDLSYSLEDCLKYLLESSKTDSGRSDLASKAILPYILRLLQLLPSRHYLNLSLKVLRNLCAGEASNQNSFVDHGGSAIVSDLLAEKTKPTEEEDFETVRFGLQVLANVVLFGEEKRQRDVWLRFFPERFLSIAKIRRLETSDPLCMILYTCFDGCSELASQLCTSDGLTIVAETIRTSSSVGSVDDYWLKLLVSRICVEDHCFPQLFSKLYNKDAEDETRFTSEQAFLLRMVSDIANERIGKVSIPKDTTSSVLGLFKKSVDVFNFASSERSELPTGSTIVDVMGYSLVIIRDACAGGSLEELKKDNKDSVDTVELLLSSGLIDLLLDLLRKLDPPTTIKRALNQSPTSSSSSLNPCPYRGFRRDIVSVIGNCAYRRKEVQDEIRERDGLFLMLQQCVTDDDNPFLREWGLWCVRNLLEGNPENQQVVAELEIQGSADVPQLREIRLRVEIDPKTSRPKLVNDT
ncbi:PREDICTED: ataxin-10-like [Camelina sativa]|uniref:Ataxin-10-like n=1 Tax=Camelina sativa TaxID=90675 RepID=A0ABM0Y7U3_CAMSA|nr:PREDICTED: ataxin-10-like [Camelina sativa]XP_010496904.1 PREDICTED: ataxin-10-like [Camelina sativa]